MNCWRAGVVKTRGDSRGIAKTGQPRAPDVTGCSERSVGPMDYTFDRIWAPPQGATLLPIEPDNAILNSNIQLFKQPVTPLYLEAFFWTRAPLVNCPVDRCIGQALRRCAPSRWGRSAS